MSKTIKEGNVTTEIVDLTGGLGNLSIDEVLARTGGKAGEIVEIQPDGSKVTYFAEEVGSGCSTFFFPFSVPELKPFKPCYQKSLILS